jgi:serine/threonine protein kinase
MGCVGFMAPEVIAKKGSSSKSDMFSWAATFVQSVLQNDQTLDDDGIEATKDRFPEESQDKIENLLTNLAKPDPAKRLEASKVILSTISSKSLKIVIFL